MRRKVVPYMILVCLLALLASGCNVYRFIPEGERLYNGAEVEIENPKAVKRKGIVKAELEDIIQPTPNRKFFGLFYTRLWFYFKTKEPKKERGLRRYFKYKIGEAPVYYSELQAQKNTKIMEKALKDQGYFGSTVKYEPNIQPNKASVKYYVTSRGRYDIGVITMPTDSSMVSDIMRNNKDELDVKTGTPYHIDDITAEREKYAGMVREQGYYDFSSDYIYFYVDTTAGNRTADIYFNVKSLPDSADHKKYYIRNVTVYPAFELSDSVDITQDTTVIDGYTFIEKERFVKPKTLKRTLLFKPGRHYSQRRYQYSLNHLLDLGTYKFVNVKYEKTGTDSLDVNVYLTPGLTQDIVAELDASTATSNFIGSTFSFAYNNRNIFKGAEEFNISATAGIETQIGAEDQSFINTLELNLVAELALPRLLVPFRVKQSRRYIPRTRISIRNDYLQRVNFFTLNSFGFTFGYDWRANSRIRHEYTLLGVNRIKTYRTSDQFELLLSTNPALRSAYSDVFIINSTYIFTYSDQRPDKPYRNYIFIRGGIDIAGNIPYAIGKVVDGSRKSPYNIGGLPFAQYAKGDLDTRYFVIINKKTSWVNRFIAGAVVPYGNSEHTPYIKQFFAGGASDMRGFRYRTLGPGGYDGANDNNSTFPDRTGDIKLELNTELRYTISGFFKGALFADIGNVWLIREDPLRPKGNFSSDFLSEMAISVGHGFRLDFNFFVIRLDVALPIRKPEFAKGDRWAFDEMQWGSSDWRKENLIWNIAIGYPF